MSYILQISKDQDFSSLVVNTIVDGETEYDFSNNDKLEYFTVYWWRVKKVNEINGNESDWSIPCWFKVVAEDVIVEHKSTSVIEYTTLNHKYVYSNERDCREFDGRLGECLKETSASAKLSVDICGRKVCGGENYYPFSDGSDVIVFHKTSFIIYDSLSHNVEII